MGRLPDVCNSVDAVFLRELGFFAEHCLDLLLNLLDTEIGVPEVRQNTCKLLLRNVPVLLLVVEVKTGFDVHYL